MKQIHLLTSSTSLHLLAAVTALGLAFACSNSEESDDGGDGSGEEPDDRPDPGETGATCEVADECFPNVAEGELAGKAVCLERVDGGYCSHECEVDEDCCSAEGECPNEFSQVCSPFESSGLNLCFLSCENEDIEAAQAGDGPPEDDSAFCQQGAGSDFICRSSGGGSSNRKVCVPGDCGVGADCAQDADCTDDLTCILDYRGGYCGQSGCKSDTDCPEDTQCAQDGETTLCLKKCEFASDCSFCRSDATGSACTEDVALADGGAAMLCQPERLED